MATSPSIPLVSTQDAIDEAKARGVSVNDLQERLPADSPEARVPLDLHLTVLSDLVVRTKDRALPAAVALRRPAEKYGILGFLALTQPDVGTALIAACRYLSFWMGGVTITPVAEDESLILEIAIPAEVASAGTLTHQLLTEVTLATLVGATRTLTSVPWTPVLSVEDEACQPPLAAALDLVVSVGRSRIEVGREASRLPCTHSQSDMAAHFERVLREAANAREARTKFQSAVRERVLTALPHGPVDLESVAKALGVSPRSLQRHLADEGATFEEIRDGTRRETALRLLSDGRLDTMSVTALLGFDERSSFHRAFKRWVGITPTEWRQRLGGPGNLQ